MMLVQPFMNMVRRAIRACGRFADHKVPGAMAPTIAVDTVNWSTRSRQIVRTACAKPSPLAEIAPRIRGTLSSVEFGRHRYTPAIMDDFDVRFKSVRAMVEAVPGWQSEPGLAQIHALAVENHSSRVIKRRIRRVDDIISTQCVASGKIKQMLHKP